ncbi:MAG: GNAT family N-acetyltransferase [Solobacterium sp.]|nr:GNAT family N-acetyltransferase [Solobacterium sp.]
MICYAKRFEELSRDELFAILKARQEVFILEQQCLYRDIDETDRKCMHVFGKDGDELITCLRYFPCPSDPEEIQIERVLTAVRGRGYGREIMEFALRRIREKRPCLEAQVYAIGFYERFGFRVVSEPFDEDGIPHVKMRLQRD